jgi:hypothetical protein
LVEIGLLPTFSITAALIGTLKGSVNNFVLSEIFAFLQRNETAEMVFPTGAILTIAGVFLYAELEFVLRMR